MGNLCHVPVLVSNVSCSALVDMRSATLVRPDIATVGIVLEQTGVKPQTMTRETASQAEAEVLFFSE